MNALRIRHGAITRGGRQVLEPGDITVELPAAIAVVGINGSGKSSLFMHLTDTLSRQRTRAFIEVNGPVTAIAYAPQVPALPPWLRVEDLASLYDTSFDDLVNTMPGLHLDELRRRRAAALSLGQQQALAIALALAQRASFMILDEPFSALDFRRRLAAIELLRAWKTTTPDRALLLSSQNAADLVDLCDYFVVIRAGRYVFTGERSALLTHGDSSSGVLHHIERQLLEMLT